MKPVNAEADTVVNSRIGPNVGLKDELKERGPNGNPILQFMRRSFAERLAMSAWSIHQRLETMRTATCLLKVLSNLAFSIYPRLKHIQKMRGWIKFYAFIFCFSLYFARLASGFSWNIRNILQPHASPPELKDSEQEESHKRISHQAASDPNQDVLFDEQPWFDMNGTPLFYGAWRAKPGRASPEPIARSIVSKHKARVACWPSSGGVWIKHADLVELDFLDLDRFADTPQQFNQTAEDEFCKRLKMIGAEWWKLPAPFEERGHLGEKQFACDTIEDCFEPDINNRYLIAWPGSEEYACFVSIARAEEQIEAKWITYYNSMTMQERCDGIMALEGRKCSCQNTCPDFDHLDYRIPEFCVD